MAMKLLLVEDDPDLREALVELLSVTTDATVVTAEDGIDALAALETFRPDLILMDFEMPRLAGPDAARLLRQRKEFSSTPIVFMTAHTGSMVDDVLNSIPGTRLMQKPFDLMEVQQLENFCQSPAGRPLQL